MAITLSVIGSFRWYNLSKEKVKPQKCCFSFDVHFFKTGYFNSQGKIICKSCKSMILAKLASVSSTHCKQILQETCMCCASRCNNKIAAQKMSLFLQITSTSCKNLALHFPLGCFHFLFKYSSNTHLSW